MKIFNLTIAEDLKEVQNFITSSDQKYLYWQKLLNAITNNKNLILKDGELLLQEELNNDYRILEKIKKFNSSHDMKDILGIASQPLYDGFIAINYYSMLLKYNQSIRDRRNYHKFLDYIQNELAKVRQKDRKRYDDFITKILKYFKKNRISEEIKKIRTVHETYDINLAYYFDKAFNNAIEHNKSKEKIDNIFIVMYLEIYRKHFENNYTYFFLINFLHLITAKKLIDFEHIKNLKIKKNTKVKKSKGNYIDYLKENSPKDPVWKTILTTLDNHFRNTFDHNDYRFTKTYMVNSKGIRYSRNKIKNFFVNISDLFDLIIDISDYHIALDIASYNFVKRDLNIEKIYKLRGDNIHNRGIRQTGFIEKEGMLIMEIYQYKLNTYHVYKFRQNDLTNIFVTNSPYDKNKLHIFFEELMMPSGVEMLDDKSEELHFLSKFKGKKIKVIIYSIIPKFDIPYKTNNLKTISIGDLEYYLVDKREHNSVKINIST